MSPKKLELSDKADFPIHTSCYHSIKQFRQEGCADSAQSPGM